MTNKLKEMQEFSEDDLISILDNEFSLVIDSYDELLDQCRRLAKVMGYNQDYIIGQVMPLRASDRTDTVRIIKWFDKRKKDAIWALLEKQKASKASLEREKLISDLGLTQEQMTVLGLDF